MEKKRVFTALLAGAALFAASFAFFSCGGRTFPEDESAGQSQKPFFSAGISAAESEVSGGEDVSEASKPTVPDPPKVKYVSFDQHPYAAIVGTCAENAEVKAVTSDGQEIYSQAFYGWFSIRYRYAAGVTVTLTQKEEEKAESGETVYSGKPAEPGFEEGVVAGKDFQFFYAKCLTDFFRLNIPSRNDLQSLKSKISGRVSALAAAGRNTKIVYILPPSSISVYPEIVPDMYKPGSGETRRQMIIAALREAGAVVIDLEDTFAQHKNDTQTIFYKTDSHWTEYAAFLAYTELFDIVKTDFPEAAPYPYDYFYWYAGFFKTGDMLNYLKMTHPVYLTPGFFDADCLEYSFFRDLSTDVTGVKRKRFEETGVYSEEVTAQNLVQTRRDALPNCIVIRDSYGTQLNDLIAGNMNTTFFQRMWDYTYSINTVKRYDADYVIYILSEWNISQVLYH